MKIIRMGPGHFELFFGTTFDGFAYLQFRTMKDARWAAVVWIHFLRSKNVGARA